MADNKPLSDLRLIRACGRSDFRGMIVRVPDAAISIRDPDQSKPMLPAAGFRRAVLRLAFPDAEPTASLKMPESVVLMTEAHAELIAGLVVELQADVGLLMVHCGSGMSRSPAVAAAVAQHLGIDPSQFFREYQPNAWVYRLTYEELKRRVKR